MPSATPFRAPYSLVRTVRGNAPSRTTGENWGRRGGFHGDSDSVTRGYAAVVLYVRRGLGLPEWVTPALEFVFDVQERLGRSWTLIPLSHGWGDARDELRHLGTDLPIRYLNERANLDKITALVCELAGDAVEPEPALVRTPFPEVDPRSVVTGGRTGVDHRDLLVFVDRAGELVLDWRWRYLQGGRLRRQTVLAELNASGDAMKWDYQKERATYTERPPAGESEET